MAEKAYVTMHVEGYITVCVADGDDEFCIRNANTEVENADFGVLKNIEWQVSSVEHADGAVEEYPKWAHNL